MHPTCQPHRLTWGRVALLLSLRAMLARRTRRLQPHHFTA
jgi:hypothetical protein